MIYSASICCHNGNTVVLVAFVFCMLLYFCVIVSNCSCRRCLIALLYASNSIILWRCSQVKFANQCISLLLPLLADCSFVDVFCDPIH